ncbi:MAG: 16S rRNA (guanine(527)-N(7))-methyltransferase RsmG [Phycisphaerales bacterium]|jgi:16S rRNA (guanine527-N7)-methyltransferase|nr:16S rRNA (guanine(527)-N(7))-methyltransferase RsmG [Phycisphaerales bacterium]MDP6693132.1 16S rRNA (guanine(527)-N(7))-methyltransferase RsmG [Phycisphaerales bacterium]
MLAAQCIPEDFYQKTASLGIAFDDGDMTRLGFFLDVLFETNRLFNLTAVKEPMHGWTRHILDSLSLLPVLSKEEAKHVIDVGSGGGLPGIPLAITMPETTFVLVEATGKKADFLRHAVDVLELDNVTVAHARAEDIGSNDGGFRCSADAVIARAVGPLQVLLELTIPFAKVGGVVIAIKGEKAQEEIEKANRALHVLHAELETSERTTTGTVLVIRKTQQTPQKYPRVPGEPKRDPIGGKQQK